MNTRAPSGTDRHQPTTRRLAALVTSATLIAGAAAVAGHTGATAADHVISDDFTRDDGPLGQTPDGQVWNQQRGEWRIEGNAAAVGGALSNATATIETGWTDVEITATITLSEGNSVAGVALRSDDGSDQVIVGFARRDDQDRLAAFKVVNNVFTQLGTQQAGVERGATYALTVRAEGADFSVSVPGFDDFSFTLGGSDAERFANRTRHGLWSNLQEDGGSRWNDITIRRLGDDPTPSERIAIMPLGDSNTVGHGDVPGGYRIELERLLTDAGHDFDFVGSQGNGLDELIDKDHEGRNGATIATIRNGFPDWYSANRADAVLLMIGTNDLKSDGANVPDTLDGLAALLREIATTAPDASVFVSTIPPQRPADANNRVTEFNAGLPALIDGLEFDDFFLVDGAAMLETSDLVDNLHLSRAGYDRLGTAWFAAIDDWLQNGPTPPDTTTTTTPPDTTTTTVPPTTTTTTVPPTTPTPTVPPTTTTPQAPPADPTPPPPAPADPAPTEPDEDEPPAVLPPPADDVTASGYQAHGPARLLDTRPGGTTIDNNHRGQGPLTANTTYTLPIHNRGGAPTTAIAAAVNLTVLDTEAPGYITLYPCGTRPNASTINFTAGPNAIANGVIVPLNNNGELCIYTNTTANVIIDLSGTYTDNYDPHGPARLLDTRPGGTTIDNNHRGQGPLTANTTYTLPIHNRGGAPTTAIAAAVNLTVLDTEAPGYITLYPCGTRPYASTINFTAGPNAIANGVIVPLNNNGELCIYTNTTANVIIDLNGTHS